MSGGGRLYLAAVDGDRPGPIRPNPVSKYEGILSDRKVVDAACRRYRTAVDGNAAVPPCGDRAAGGIGNDRAAVDGNTAAIPGTAAANSHVESSYSGPACDRFGSDDAAVDGNAAAQSLFGGVSAGGYVRVILERSADRRCSVLPSGADITAVDNDRTLAFVDTVVGLLPAHASANTGQPFIGPYNIINAPVAVEIFRKARRQLAHGVLAGALGIDGEGIALLHIDAPLRCEVAAVLQDKIDLALRIHTGRDGHVALHHVPAGRQLVPLVLQIKNAVCGIALQHGVFGADLPLAVRVQIGHRVKLNRIDRFNGNAQLLRIAARTVGSLDGEGGASRCGRRAADLAGVLVQAQIGRQVAVFNAPRDRRSAVGGQGLAVRCAHLAVCQGVRGDGGGGGSVFADGKVVLRLAAVVPRAVQRHLGGLFRVKARVVRFEGVGMDVVGIDGGVVRVLRKLLRFVLARLMGKPRQLLFAAV